MKGALLVAGTTSDAGKSVVTDRIGAMDRVVADHYRSRARPPR